ncbi:MAG: DUF4922 domain-containing protein [Pirellulales bacterium]|nr:DUF4922 domain-containing protein [Pirellulales bacterium]
MSWEKTILDIPNSDMDLVTRIDALFAHQRAHWKAMRDGQAALAKVRVKILRDASSQVMVQANPGRARSIHARVDPQSIANRRCFLCPEHLPSEERGIAFGGMVILPNPYPILPRHCTIADRIHRPQQLAGHLKTLLELAQALGPLMLVFYNGPNCGASAPDHLHFQACDARNIPLFDERPLSELVSGRFGHASFGRTMIVVADPDANRVETMIQGILDRLNSLDKKPGFFEEAGLLEEPLESSQEPMVSLLALYREGRFICVLFPRVAHRPACYFAESAHRIAVSPAALEMAGLLVVAEPEHFDRVNATSVRSIYEEVCLFREKNLNRFLEGLKTED